MHCRHWLSYSWTLGSEKSSASGSGPGEAKEPGIRNKGKGLSSSSLQGPMSCPDLFPGLYGQIGTQQLGNSWGGSYLPSWAQICLLHRRLFQAGTFWMYWDLLTQIRPSNS